ncbi:MAG TPA: hypothetical protein VJ650_17655 [Gemmatimonadaceae bacterium]|nr:hypothetical protein [Gemmatimonadaceae bacterium]
MRPWRRLVVLLVGMAGVHACSEVGTDPDVPVAIEIDPPVLPAIAAGDSLRDTLGVVTAIRARAFNSRNELIADAPIRFVALRSDTAIIAVDSATGRIAGLREGVAQVVAQVAGLQSIRLSIRVTSAPDTVYPLSALVDSVLYNLADDTARTLTVAVARRDTTADGRDTLVMVPFWRVRYTIVEPPDLATNTDTTRVYIADGSNRASRVDTTDAAGASRRIRFPVAVVSDTTRRTFVTEVVVMRSDGAPLPGSPLLFTTVIRPRLP